MPWTTPETFTAGQTLTAASMNLISENTRVLRALANVQQTVLPTASSSSLATATTTGDVSGLTVAITPTATTSKVLVTCSLVVDLDLANPIYALLYRGGSVTAGIGDASGSRARVTASVNCAANAGETLTFQYLDSPATASSVTYSVRLRTGSGGTRTVYINGGPSGTDSAVVGRTISTITAAEIPA